jgi:tRNA G18 (ribose-2'-O)-methylase SpoU
MIFGFHAVTSRIRHEASSVEEIYVDSGRSDRRMQELLHAAKSAGIRIFLQMISAYRTSLVPVGIKVSSQKQGSYLCS